MEAARREPYFSNTIFVFVGDHGVAGNADGLYPSVWSELRLTDEHVPLLFFAPQLLAPQQRREVVSQIDILPTIAGMLDQSYLNTTLGRDLLDPFKKHDFAFVTNTADLIGMVTNDHVYMRNINSNEEQLRYLRAGTDPHTPAQRDSLRLRLAAFTEAYFETARYLIMNNKPR
jgi:phosphoglycerol transferase MdoB-like AlkP superfamily enzyme